METKLAPGAIFREQVMYPEDACREALINAIAHRDYSIEGRGIEIFIFDDRMEVRSPGALLSTVRIEDLRRQSGVHQSRNALVARVLREVGYMREMGEGIRRIFSLMKDHDLVAPELKSDSVQFTITLKHRSVFSEADQRWLSEFELLRLTREEMLVALLGKNGNLISAQQIWDTLDLVDTEVYRAIIEGLQIKGLLYNALRVSEAHSRARRSGVSNRRVARFAIRQPRECEIALRELFNLLAQQPPEDTISGKLIDKLARELPEKSPYKMDRARLPRLLRLLELIDDDRRPGSMLQGIWKLGVKNETPIELTDASEDPKPSDARSMQYSSREASHRRATGIFVGNLSFDATPDDLRTLFSEIGEVLETSVPLDYYTGRSRGFGFVTMGTSEEAAEALARLNGRVLFGRPVRLDWDDRKSRRQ